MTVNGAITLEAAGRMLVHEHVLVGFIEDGKLTPNDYIREEVIEKVLPHLLKLREVGGQTFMDCSPEYLGRDPYLLKELASLSGLHIVTNTGIYKAPYLPSFVYTMTEQELAKVWIREAKYGIGESGVYPGFIKIAVNDNRINETQQTILKAAMRASLETGLPIQCHTVGKDTILHLVELLNEVKFDYDRFTWVHAQTCPDMEVHRTLVEQGMWISIDSIKPGNYQHHVELLHQLKLLGVGERVLLSQDTGWFTVGEEHGGEISSYHYLFEEFFPYAAENGISSSWLEQCVTVNAFEAMRLRS